MAKKNKQLETLVKNLSDREWRLENLYHIIDKQGNKTHFKLNWAQRELLNNTWYCNIILKARQLGISTYVDILFLDACLWNPDVSAGIIAHTREDSEFLFQRVKLAYDALPDDIKAIVQAESDSVRELRFTNGSMLRVGTSLRSATFQYLHISEFGKICSRYPDKAREIVTGALNTLAPGQYVFIESTAEGKEGYFYELCKQAQALKHSKTPLTQLDYRFFFFPWYKDPSYTVDPKKVMVPQSLQDYFLKLQDTQKIEVTEGQKAWYTLKWKTQGDDMKREFPSYPEEAFEGASEGHYYAAYVVKARKEGRITKVYYDTNVPVHTAWDLGYGDSTAIWLFQLVGQEIHVLDYYENSNEPLPHYLKWLKEKEYSYGHHFVPHDAAAHEYSTGFTRMEVAGHHGFTFTLVPKISVEEGIDAARAIFNRCWFDEERCSEGLRCLENYRREWSERHGAWTNRPFHSWASHGADAFRYLACSMHMITGASMSKDDVRKLREKYFGGGNTVRPGW